MSFVDTDANEASANTQSTTSEADPQQTSSVNDPAPNEPAKEAGDQQTSAVTAAETEPADASNANYTSFIFRDGLDMPIPGLELFITLPSGQVCTAISTSQGAVTVPIPPKATGEATVEVKDAKGERQTVCRVDMSKCENTAVVIQSPKVKVDLPLRPHQQTPSPSDAASTNSPSTGRQPSEASKKQSQISTEPQKVDIHSPWWGAIGSVTKAWEWLIASASLPAKPPQALATTPVVAKTLSTAGQPVTVVVGPEVADKDNLRLGRNNVYRSAILASSKRLGLIPQALCALMDCEAGKVKEVIPMLDDKGQPLLDKKGKPRVTVLHELWNANAGNAQSGAAGLTQFLASTWLGHVMIPGRYIHDQSKAAGWVKQEADTKGKSRWVFVLTDGKTTADPYSKRSTDENVKKCLAMRMDPTWSINAAADYGNVNLKLLESLGFKVSGLNGMDKAKMMYLMHHEGEGAGPLFIRNTLAPTERAKAALRRKFATQLGGNGGELAEAKINKADGDVEAAYRWWLTTFIDKNFFGATKYFFSKPVSISNLTDILVAIGGKEIQIVD